MLPLAEMLAVFLKTLPFFALIGLGYAAVRARVFTAEGTAWLTRFVFFFPLSALLFGFAARLPLDRLLDARLGLAWLGASTAIYALVMAVGILRGCSVGEAAIEAQCATIGNTGFFGIPLMTALVGPEIVPPMLLMLMIDSVVFPIAVSAIVVAGTRGRIGLRAAGEMGLGVLQNPMIIAIGAGLAVSAAGIGLPAPVDEFVTMLAGAATPAALFAIGASLAGKSAERWQVAAWLSLGKLVLLPFAALAMAGIMGLDPGVRAVMIIYAAMPVAGNVYMLAAHYGLAPQRVSSAILISTAVSILTLPPVLHWMLP